MKVSKRTIKLIAIQYLERDGDSNSDALYVVLPCVDDKTAREFEKFYKEKFPPTQLMNITIFDSPIYG